MNYLIENKTYKTMNRIRLTESQLHNVIRRCINEALSINESNGKFAKYLPQVIDMFNDFYHKNENAVNNHILAVKKENEYKDFETRIAYDIARVLKYWEWDFIANGNNDTIRTLLVTALKKSDIPYEV